MCLPRQLLMSCRLHSPQSERCHCCAQPHGPCPSLGMGNPQRPPHTRHSFSAFIRQGVGAGAGLGQLVAVGMVSAPQSPLPSLGTHAARCRTGGAAGDPSATGVSPWEGRAVLVLIPSLLGVMSLGWGCTFHLLHHPQGAGASQRPQVPTHTQGQRWGQSGRGGQQRVQSQGPHHLPTSRGTNTSPLRGWGQSNRRTHLRLVTSSP